MRSITPAQRSTVITLLQDGYTYSKIQTKTGLGKATISRVKAEALADKENNPSGHPSKLTTHDKQSIICQISTGKLDNAVQAAHFINSVISEPVHPQTVRNALKEHGFRSATKKKVPMLKKVHRQKRLDFAQQHQSRTIEDWKRVLWTDETKINRIGSDGKVYVWKQHGESISDWTSLPTVKHGGGIISWYGGLWGGMGWEC